jgi:hypothetical protein
LLDFVLNFIKKKRISLVFVFLCSSKNATNTKKHNIVLKKQEKLEKS